MQESEIDVLLAQAREEGRFDSSGRFTVLLRRAQNHAGKDFSSLYPGGYLLRAVQCAVSAGCQDIRIECLSSRATVQMVGAGPTQVGTRLLQALESPLSFRKQDPMGHLAICILAALAQGASRIEWSCFDGQRGEMLIVSQDTVDLRTLQRQQWKGKERSGFLLTVHRDASKTPLEMHLLQSRCGFCPVSLTLNGKQMRGTAWHEQRPLIVSDWYKGYAQPGFRLAERYLYYPKSVPRSQTLGFPAFKKARYGSLDSGPVKRNWFPRAQNVFLGSKLQLEGSLAGAIALPIEMQGKSRVTWVQYGVCLQNEFHRLGFPGAIAVLEASALKTDLTGLKVVQDEEHEAALEGLRSEIKSLVQSYQLVLSRLRACPQDRPGLRRLQAVVGVALGISGVAIGTPALAAAGAAQVIQSFLPGQDFSSEAKKRAQQFQLDITYRMCSGDD